MKTKRCGSFLLSAGVVLLLGASPPASAERIASRAEGASARAEALARAGDAVARDEVARALAAHGLTAADVEERLARLSDEDLQRLAANLDQVHAAGAVPNYIWILLGIFLAVSILVMVF